MHSKADMVEIVTVGVGRWDKVWMPQLCVYSYVTNRMILSHAWAVDKDGECEPQTMKVHSAVINKNIVAHSLLLLTLVVMGGVMGDVMDLSSSSAPSSLIPFGAWTADLRLNLGVQMLRQAMSLSPIRATPPSWPWATTSPQ